jgi:hypothetical protein
MIESSDKQIDILIGEIFGYINMYDNLLANTKIVEDNNINASFEPLGLLLSDWLLTRYSSSENNCIFSICVSSLRTIELLKRLGVVEHWVDSFQAAILELSMLSNMDESTKNIIQQIYFLRII